MNLITLVQNEYQDLFSGVQIDKNETGCVEIYAAQT
jgi:hypothetical protein